MSAEGRRLAGAACRGALVLILGPSLGGCGGPASDAAGSVAVDTLAGGTVEVRNPAEGLWGATPAWSLVEDLRLGSVTGDSPETFGQVVDIEVDAEGRVWVLDGDAAEVRIFGPDGASVGTFGRRGEGPGELNRPRALALGPGGRVWIVDPGNQRYTLVDGSGTLVEERRRFAGGNVYPWPGAVLEDGRVVDVDTRAGERSYTVRDREGRVTGSVELPPFESPSFVHTTEASRVSAGVPYAPRLHVAFDPRGFVWTGIPEDYRIVRRDLTGRDSLLVVRLDHEPVPVTPLEADVAMENLRWFREQGGEVDRSRFPEHHPAFRDILVDRLGYLWVRPVTPRPEAEAPEDLRRPAPAVFDVFDDGGRYLGRLDAGAALSSVRITGGHLYGVTRDELGVQHVVRLRIEGRRSG